MGARDEGIDVQDRVRCAAGERCATVDLVVAHGELRRSQHRVAGVGEGVGVSDDVTGRVVGGRRGNLVDVQLRVGHRHCHAGRGETGPCTERRVGHRSGGDVACGDHMGGGAGHIVTHCQCGASWAAVEGNSAVHLVVVHLELAGPERGVAGVGEGVGVGDGLTDCAVRGGSRLLGDRQFRIANRGGGLRGGDSVPIAVGVVGHETVLDVSGRDGVRGSTGDRATDGKSGAGGATVKRGAAVDLVVGDRELGRAERDVADVRQFVGVHDRPAHGDEGLRGCHFGDGQCRQVHRLAGRRGGEAPAGTECRVGQRLVFHVVRGDGVGRGAGDRGVDGQRRTIGSAVEGRAAEDLVVGDRELVGAEGHVARVGERVGVGDDVTGCEITHRRCRLGDREVGELDGRGGRAGCLAATGAGGNVGHRLRSDVGGGDHVCRGAGQGVVDSKCRTSGSAVERCAAVDLVVGDRELIRTEWCIAGVGEGVGVGDLVTGLRVDRRRGRLGQ